MSFLRSVFGSAQSQQQQPAASAASAATAASGPSHGGQRDEAAVARASRHAQLHTAQRVVLPACKHAVCRACVEERFHESAVVQPPRVCGSAKPAQAVGRVAGLRGCERAVLSALLASHAELVCDARRPMRSRARTR